MEAALEAGADDVVAEEDGSVEVYTTFADFLSVNEALTAAGFKGDEAEVAMIPSITAPIADLETAQKVLKLIDMLEDLDDVQNVYHNAEIPDEIMEQLG
ncbi:Transcriptional regulatory protein PmpR [compost metagenome]